MGSLYRRPNSQHYWVKYSHGGKIIRDSTGTAKLADAKRLLKERDGRAAAGMPMLPRADKILYDEVAADLREHYRTTGSRNLDEAETRLKPLDVFFTRRRLTSIGGAEATAYAAGRQAETISNATINRELAMLVKMLRLAYENRKLLRLPVIRKLKEAPPRSGFFEHEQFAAVRRHLPEDLQVAVSIAYTLGWRMQSEVLTLERRQLDLTTGAVRLDPGQAKNDDGRVCFLTPELVRMLTEQLGRVDSLQKTRGEIIRWIFPVLPEGNVPRRLVGRRRKNFRKAWASACKRAGVPHMLKHDLRRTAVRNMVGRGVPERVAMKVTGHRTRAVFDRYHIVSPGDLQDVARKMAGTVSGVGGS